MSHSRQKKRTFSSQTTGRDYAVNLYEFIVKDGQYNVYAMDYKDAWETLFENEPKIKTTDIMFMMETKRVEYFMHDISKRCTLANT